MQTTKEQREKAGELAKKHKVDTLWINKGGEFFTSENLALISVNGKKNKIAKIEIKSRESKPKGEQKTNEN